MNHSLSRRSVAKGAAWAVPAITVAAAAPAVAASLPPQLVANNTVTFGRLPNNSPSGDSLYRVYTSPDDLNDPPNTVAACGPEVKGANSSTTVTNVSMTYWLPQSNLTFVKNSAGAATSGWSTLTRSTAMDGSHYDALGNRLYAYVTAFSGPIAVNGSGAICLGIQNFVSTSSNGQEPETYDATILATIDGRTQSVPGVDVQVRH